MDKSKVFMIVGLGLMGGSYALALVRQGYVVWATDKDPEALRWAQQNGLVQKTARADDVEGTAALLRGADVIVLSLYPSGILQWLTRHKPYFKPGALVTDLAGVKGCFVPQAQKMLAPNFEFIPCHPMAGREKLGVQNASDAIFKGANFIVTPTQYNTQKGIDFAAWLAQTLGFARCVTLTVEQHDKLIGYVSQLTHAIAVSLMNANPDPLLPEVTGDSFRELTRIADINAPLWSELFLANKDALADEIDLFTACLQDLKEKLLQGDKEGLEELFCESTRLRRRFNPKDE